MVYERFRYRLPFSRSIYPGKGHISQAGHLAKIHRTDFPETQTGWNCHECLGGPREGITWLGAEEIKVGDIIRATEGNLDLVFCLSHNKAATKSCDRAVHCVARDIWHEASARLLEYFDSITLQDLCKQAQQRGIERVIDKHLMYYI